MSDLPTSARVVIVGGGIAGCSVAYHIAKLGITDVVLLERGKLTSGTTWHAAGLIMQLRTTHTMTELCSYGAQLYAQLEAETGQSTGFKANGSLPIARTPERLTEIMRLASLAKVFGLEAHPVTPTEARDIYPHLDPGQICGGLFIPGDGQTNPVDTTMALAKGARMAGVKIIEDISVTKLDVQGDRICAVETDRGRIDCETAVLTAGLWTRDLASRIGVHVPLYAAEHMYVLAHGVAGVKPDLPVLRDTDGYVYVKEDAGNLLIGCFEPNAKPKPVEEMPQNGQFIEFGEDWDQFELPMTKAIEMVPALENAEIRKFLNGPESFTPDNRFIVGEAPEVGGVFVAAGFNSQGILAGAGVGRALAEWIAEGGPTMDLSEIDIARFHPFQTNRRYLSERTSESLGLLYAMHWPHRQVETARPVRLTPLHDRLIARNACMGEAAGWERANWYAPQGMTPQYEYSYGRQNWFEPVRAEHMAAREAVALFDLSSFGKIEIAGADALCELQRICSANMDVPVGRAVYTAMLNPRGGIEADVTITRLAPDRFRLVTAAASQQRDMAWLRRNITTGAHVVLTDVTSGLGVLALMGPNARALLNRVSPHDFSNAAFPFGTAQDIEIARARATALRLTYVGELGWELYMPTEFIGPIFDALMEAGEDLGLRLAGYHALDSLRNEKGYRHWGHDVSPADTPVEAGIGFVAALKAKKDFIGRAVIERQKAEGVTRRLVHILLDDPAPILLHDEPIWRDDQIVGRVTSGSYGCALGASVGQGYVTCDGPVTADWITAGRYQIEIAGERHAAQVSLRPFYDPDNTRTKQ